MSNFVKHSSNENLKMVNKHNKRRRARINSQSRPDTNLNHNARTIPYDHDYYNSRNNSPNAGREQYLPKSRSNEKKSPRAICREQYRMKTRYDEYLMKNRNDKYSREFHPPHPATLYDHHDNCSGKNFSPHTRTSGYHENGRGRLPTSTKSDPPISPALGSEEHTLMKIRHTSAIIMRQLLNPEDDIIAKSIRDNSLESEKEPDSNIEKTSKKTPKVNKNKTKETSYSVEEIHNKIMSHLTNLNNGKKRNLINSNSTGYDEPIQQIMKQKRLEISRALRDMCNDDTDTNSTDFINSIIPDMGIKIEELPLEFLEELRCSFDFSIQNGFPMMNNDYSECGFNYSHNAEMCPPSTNYNNSFYSPTTSDTFFNTSISFNSSSVPSPNSSTVDLTNDELEDSENFNGTQASENNIGSPLIPENYNSEEEIHVEKLQDNKDSKDLKKFPETDIFIPLDTDYSIMEGALVPDQCNSDVATSATTNTEDIKLSEGQILSPASSSIIDDTITQSTSELMITECNQMNISEKNVTAFIDNGMKYFEVDVEIKTQNTRLDKNVSDSDQPSSSESRMFEATVVSDDPDKNVVEIRQEDIYNENIELKNECPETCEDIKDFENLNLCNEELVIKGDENPDEGCQACEYSEASTQTKNIPDRSMTLFLAQVFPKPPLSVNSAVKRMLSIDNYISELLNYRKTVLHRYILEKKKEAKNKKKNIKVKKGKNPSIKNKKKKKGKEEDFIEANEKVDNEVVEDGKDPPTKNKERKEEKIKTKKKVDEKVATKRKNNTNTIENESSESVGSKHDRIDDNVMVKRRKNNSTGNDHVETEENAEESISSDVPDNRLIIPPLPVQNMLVFNVQESYLDLKVFEDKLLAATQSGNIIFFSLEDGHYVDILKVSKKPISSLSCLQAPDGKMLICVGSCDSYLHIYNFYSHSLLVSVRLNENAQCMEYNWGYLFLGGSKGSILRFSMKKRAIEYEDKFYDDCIFVLKATQEGARRVLLIGSRNSPVVIRDAMNGLHLRTMQDLVCPTVYSLVIENSLVYCGTTNLDILVFNFHNGRLEHKLKATNAKGIGCLKIFGRLLFASCHNGNVYVYNIENNTFIGTLEGPGGVILSMEVFVNQVVVGTMLPKFVSLPIPEHILKLK